MGGLHPSPWLDARARIAELSPVPARPDLGGDVPTPMTPQGCPRITDDAPFADHPPCVGCRRELGGGPRTRDLVMGSGAPWVGTKRVGHPTAGSGSSEHPTEQLVLPEPPPPGGRAVLRRDGARQAPREPVAGLAEVGSGRMGAAGGGGTHLRPQPGGAGGKAGAGRQRELPGHACGGRDEADERQACRRRFIGDAQRLWQYVTPHTLGWGCCPEPPSNHPGPSPPPTAAPALWNGGVGAGTC